MDTNRTLQRSTSDFVLQGPPKHSSRNPKGASHLERDLLRRHKDTEEVAHVQEGIEATGAVIPLQVVPARLDELLAVGGQLLGHLQIQQSHISTGNSRCIGSLFAAPRS